MAADEVLVVEGDADIGAALAELLALAGWRPRVVRDDAAALAWLDAHPAPALVVVDLPLPGPDAAGLAAWRADPRLAGVPVLVVSARADGARVAADAPFLAKPFDVGALLGAVAALGGRAVP